MSRSPRSRLGTYEILGPLGAGGMGEVYRAKDLRLGREVAVKMLPSDVASTPSRLARFEREARTVAGLNHPNIVTLFSVEDQDGVRFLTMELVEGQTLSTLITPGGLPLPKLLDLAIPLTDALVAAHDRGVIHRDLKPGNVMVTREGRVKVLDFGLAKVGAGENVATERSAAATVDLPLSREGMMVGTVPYMAPEQIRGESADARSDLFSLGIILYELAAGRRPFTGETPIDVSHAILRETPEPLGRFRADLPADFERIVSRCLEKNPRERAQSALDVNNELRRLRMSLERGEPEKPASEQAASIAVLPFANRSASADDEYFSDGLTDELLSVLAKIKGLRVSARTSSFHFKGKDTTIAEIGRTLHVASVLEGSVRKAGNRVRISVQLVKVSDGYHIWSETYDRTLEDIFAVQDDIAQSVVKELRATLLGEEADSDASGRARAEVARATRGRGTDPEAHRLYLLGRYFFDRWTREDTTKALEYVRRSLELDPEFAIAWALLGAVYMREGDRGWAPAAEAYGRAREAVERTLALEPDLAEGHAQIGRIRMIYDRDWRGAEAAYRRALELSPGNATVLEGAGAMARTLGRTDEAMETYRRAVEQDPLSPFAYFNLGMALYAADRFAEAEAAFRRKLELSPQSTGTHAFLALTLMALGRGEEAFAEVILEPEEWTRLWALSILRHAGAKQPDSDAALGMFIEKYGDEGAYQVAEAYGARGQVDLAFDWLERAYTQRDGGLAELRASPHLRSLHGDPRWGAFLRKMGLEEERQL